MTDIPYPDGDDSAIPIDDFGSRNAGDDVPYYLDSLPESGREVLVFGDVQHCKDFNHQQGMNLFGFESTCGLVSCEDILRQFEIDVTENDIVRHALDSGLCSIGDDPASSGGTTLQQQSQILTDAGVPSHPEANATISDLTRWVTEGRGVALAVNAGVLWNEPDAYDQGQSNHSVVLTGIGIDPDSGETIGIYINDSGRGYPGDSGEFVPLARANRMWSQTGALCVVTDVVKPFSTGK